MSALPRKSGFAFAARLERFIRRQRAVANAQGVASSRLTLKQKNASEPRLSRTCVAQAQHFLTVQENNHARLL